MRVPAVTPISARHAAGITVRPMSPRKIWLESLIVMLGSAGVTFGALFWFL